MGYNSSKPFNVKEHYETKPTKEIQKLLLSSEAFLNRYPNMQNVNYINYVNTLRSIIASRIGNKK
jgi:outer membrane protein assembly factor BamD (BamD/ComL family)